MPRAPVRKSGIYVYDVRFIDYGYVTLTTVAYGMKLPSLPFITFCCVHIYFQSNVFIISPLLRVDGRHSKL
jgi:hypothetical protein